MKKLYEIQRVIIEQFAAEMFYARTIFKSINFDNSITGIVGSRGIGKTTYLLHSVVKYNNEKPDSALYVSADNPFFLDNTLLDVADYLYKETDTILLCIDEIHKYPNWEQELKNIADIYKQIKVLFTGSSMIDIVHSKFDLSRRVTLHRLGGLSFREYLEFYLKEKIAPLDLATLCKNHMTIANDIKVKQVLKHFREYLQSGYYLFSKNLTLEYDKFQAIENISQKSIYEDIGLLHELKTASLYYIEKTYKYILNSMPGELNTNKLAGLVGKSHDQITNYLMWLEQAGLINSLQSNKSGKAFLKAAQKLLPENTNLMYAAYLPQIENEMIGKVRESFVVNQFRNAKYKTFYSKIGDIEVDDFFFEIGGKNKSGTQLKGKKHGFVIADDILVGDKHTIPLYLFGLLY